MITNKLKKSYRCLVHGIVGRQGKYSGVCVRSIGDYKCGGHGNLKCEHKKEIKPGDLNE